MRTKGGKSHLRRRSAKRVRNKFSKSLEVTATGDAKRIKRLAPYLRRYRQNPPG